jgi:NADH:ubiquinone oxidoreductase subunit 6 (subunit J)
VWLAGASASVALLLYALGAYEVAVIELSVGTGLVTVLLVFAIGIAGEDAIAARSLVPQPLAWGLVLLAIGLLAWSMLPTKDTLPTKTTMPLTQMVWEQRALDLYVQVVVIFAGVLGVLGLLSETRKDFRFEIADCRLENQQDLHSQPVIASRFTAKQSPSCDMEIASQTTLAMTQSENPDQDNQHADDE